MLISEYLSSFPEMVSTIPAKSIRRAKCITQAASKTNKKKRRVRAKAGREILKDTNESKRTKMPLYKRTGAI